MDQPCFCLCWSHALPNTSVDMYASDCTITEAVEEKLNNDLHEESKWCEENKMVINAEKTKIMLITTRQKSQHLHTTDPDEQINGENIQVVNSERLLRVEIDRFLSWSSHVQKTHTTIARYITLLCMIKKYFPYQARQTFCSFILPHMDYCSTLWGEASAAEDIHKLQKCAARVITDSPYRMPSAPLFEQLRIQESAWLRIIRANFLNQYKLSHPETHAHMPEVTYTHHEPGHSCTRTH